MKSLNPLTTNDDIKTTSKTAHFKHNVSCRNFSFVQKKKKKEKKDIPYLPEERANSHSSSASIILGFNSTSSLQAKKKQKGKKRKRRSRVIDEIVRNAFFCPSSSVHYYNLSSSNPQSSAFIHIFSTYAILFMNLNRYRFSFSHLCTRVLYIIFISPMDRRGMCLYKSIKKAGGGVYNERRKGTEALKHTRKERRAEI